MAHFDLSLYETVAQRLVRWWVEYPEGRIITSIHHYDGSTIIMRAECFNNDDRLIATGYAEEVFGNSAVNKTSFLENCETSAIGRAISNSRIGHTGERASVTEMDKVNRINSAPKTDSHGSASPKQIAFLKSLVRGKGWDDTQALEFIHRVLQVDDVILETLTSGQATVVIDGLKK
jgi:hypothetical protein